MIATQGVIPYFNQGREHAGIGRYQYLGKSVLEIAANLILKPHLILGRLFSLDTLEYLVLLVFPVIWWISPRHLTPLISAVPMLGMNILSDIPAQRDLIHQYSIPILLFLLVAAIANLSHQNLQEAIALVQTTGNILTTSHIAPHLTHRSVVKLTQADKPPVNLTEFEYVLLNLRYPGWMSDRNFVQNLITQLTNHPQFQLKYQRDDIFLFTKK